LQAFAVHHIAATTGFILFLTGSGEDPVRWKKRIQACTYRESHWFASQNHASHAVPQIARTLNPEEYHKNV